MVLVKSKAYYLKCALFLGGFAIFLCQFFIFCTRSLFFGPLAKMANDSGNTG